MKKELTIKDELTEFLLYTSPTGDIKVDVFLHNENIWLTQKRMTELFGVTKSTISEHLTNIFKSEELDENSVVRDFRTTAEDGKKYEVKFYNLDAILSVGYRVNSTQATQFRIWASKMLKEYIIKGFAMDDERLKNGQYFGKDYLGETEIKQLEKTVSSYFDYIERMIEARTTFTMEKLAESINEFLQFNKYEIFSGKGKISHIKAEQKAFFEYDKFNKTQKIDSDFEKQIKKISSNKK